MIPNVHSNHPAGVSLELNATRIALAFLLALVFFAFAALAGETRICFIPRALGTQHWNMVRKGAESVAERHSDTTFVWRGPERQDDIPGQERILREEIERGADVIIIAPNDDKNILPLLDEAHAKGIRIILFDSSPNWESAACMVGPNGIMGGIMAADLIARLLDGRGRVAIITGFLNQSPAVNRANGAREAFRIRRGIKLAGVRMAGWSRERARTETLDLLKDPLGLDAIFCCNGDMTLGALDAVREAGTDTIIVGFDASPEILQAIASGKLAGTVTNNAFHTGRMAMNAAIRLAGGRRLPGVIDTGQELITRENVAIFQQEK